MNDALVVTFLIIHDIVHLWEIKRSEVIYLELWEKKSNLFLWDKKIIVFEISSVPWLPKRSWARLLQEKVNDV